MVYFLFFLNDLEISWTAGVRKTRRKLDISQSSGNPHIELEDDEKIISLATKRAFVL